jgi:hypothetical protein
MFDMAINMSTMVYMPCQDLFSRPVTFSSTLGNSFSGTGRGIYDSSTINVVLEDGSIYGDQNTILDIRTVEFPTLPVQGDTINIPYDPASGMAALGNYEITNVWHNGGGEVTLQLRAIGGSGGVPLGAERGPR